MSRLAAMFVALWLALPPAAFAQSAADAQAIERTIRDQLSAMRADDWPRAFAFASPSIRRMFRTPESFARMVTNGYPMVWRPRSHRVKSLTGHPQGLIQTMIFEDMQGRIYIADYHMIRVGDEWRINGVTIREAPAGV